MDKQDASRLIHKSHEILSHAYGDLDIQGNVACNTLQDWNYQANVRSPIKTLVKKHFRKDNFLLLDAGCGNGQLFHVYRELGAKIVYGVDFGVSMLRLAVERSRKNNLKFVPLKANLEELGFIKSRSIDIINLYGVIEHLPDPVKVMQELERLLSPGGIMIVAVPRKWSLAWLCYLFFCRSLADYAREETFFDKIFKIRKMALYKFYTAKEIKDILSSLKHVKLVDSLSIAHGGLVGWVDKPLRQLAQRGNYDAINRWNKLCESLRFVPAGEYLVLKHASQ